MKKTYACFVFSDVKNQVHVKIEGALGLSKYATNQSIRTKKRPETIHHLAHSTSGRQHFDMQAFFFVPTLSN